MVTENPWRNGQFKSIKTTQKEIKGSKSELLDNTAVQYVTDLQFTHPALGGADLRECKHSDGSVLQWWRRTCTSFSQWRRLGEEERVCVERRRNR